MKRFTNSKHRGQAIWFNVIRTSKARLLTLFSYPNESFLLCTCIHKISVQSLCRCIFSFEFTLDIASTSKDSSYIWATYLLSADVIFISHREFRRMEKLHANTVVLRAKQIIHLVVFQENRSTIYCPSEGLDFVECLLCTVLYKMTLFSMQGKFDCMATNPVPTVYSDEVRVSHCWQQQLRGKARLHGWKSCFTTVHVNFGLQPPVTRHGANNEKIGLKR